ncbi:MAG: VOC family protein [Formosimonas sp.]
MSTQLEAYLSFNDGQCEAALNFYKAIFKGDITMMMRFSDAPMPYDEASKNNVMHARFEAEQVCFMASDSMPNQPVQFGNNVTLALNFADEAEETRVFNALSESGTVTMPLADMFWGAHFGMLVDKFGHSWMFNCDKAA